MSDKDKEWDDEDDPDLDILGSGARDNESPTRNGDWSIHEDRKSGDDRGWGYKDEEDTGPDESPDRLRKK